MHPSKIDETKAELALRVDALLLRSRQGLLSKYGRTAGGANIIKVEVE